MSFQLFFQIFSFLFFNFLFFNKSAFAENLSSELMLFDIEPKTVYAGERVRLFSKLDSTGIPNSIDESVLVQIEPKVFENKKEIKVFQIQGRFNDSGKMGDEIAKDEIGHLSFVIVAPYEEKPLYFAAMTEDNFSNVIKIDVKRRPTIPELLSTIWHKLRSKF